MPNPKSMGLGDLLVFWAKNQADQQADAERDAIAGVLIGAFNKFTVDLPDDVVDKIKTRYNIPKTGDSAAATASAATLAQ
jgi:hypothetical protein